MEALKTKQFWTLNLMLFNGIFFGSFLASVYKDFGSDGKISDKALTVTGSIGSVGNGVSRIVWSALSDKYGFKKMYILVMIIQLVCTVAISSCNTVAPLYTAVVALSFCCEGGHFTLFPAASAYIFGITNGGVIYTAMAAFMPIGSLLCFMLVEMDVKESLIFYVAAALTAINMVILYFFND